MGNGVRAACVRLIGLPVCLALLAACGGGGGGNGGNNGGGGDGSGGGGGGGGNTPPPNAAPTIQDQAFSGTEDVPLAGQLAASDPGDTVTFSVVTNPAHGALSLTTVGQFTYSPAANFNGEDTFQVRVADSANQIATATMRITLVPVNDAPTAANDVLQVTSTNTLTVLTNDVDIDGDALAIDLQGTPLVGTGSVNGDGTVALTLPAGFKGFTKFDYRITDPAGVSAQATAQVFVGIAPFSVIHYGVPNGGGPPGIYLNDLFTSRLVHPPDLTGSFDSLTGNLKVSADGSALTYFVRQSNGATQVWYVDVDHLGVHRAAVNLTGSQQPERFIISPNGRYVATVVRTPGPPEVYEMVLFDAQSTAPPSRISLDPAIHIYSTDPQFNAMSTALYYRAGTPNPTDTAIYKADLSTRAVVRVTPVISSAVANTIGFWVSPDDSRIVHLRILSANGRELRVTPSGQPDVEVLLHEPSLADPFYPSIAPDFDNIVIPTLSGPDEDRVKLGRISAPGTTVPAGPVDFMRGINAFSIFETLRWRHDASSFLTCSPGNGGVCRVYEVTLNDLDHPHLVNAPILASESATNGAYSSDGERISYTVDGLFKRELHVTTPATMGVSSTLVSPAGVYLSSFRLDPSGRVAIMLVGDRFLLVNLDAPDRTLKLADQSYGIGYLEAIAPRWP